MMIRKRIVVALATVVFLPIGNALALPTDLSVASSDISFSNGAPEPNQTITITAAIHNAGDVYVDTTPVSQHDTHIGGTGIAAIRVRYNYWVAQRFVAGGNYYLGGVAIKAFSITQNPSTPLTVQIRREKGSLLPDDTAGGLLAEKSLVISSTSSVWQDFLFDEQPLLQTGATYWICAQNYTQVDSTYAWVVDTGTPVDMMSVYSVNGGISWNSMAGDYDGYFKVYKCTDTIVSCYAGDPGAGGTLIGTEVFPTPVPSGSTKTAQFPWSAAAAGTDIYVTVDAPGIITESDETTNNTAYKNITPSATVPAVAGTVSPAENAADAGPAELLTMTFSEDMSSQTVTAAFSVKAVVNNSGVSINDAVAGAVAYADKTLTFAAAWEKGFTYLVTLSTGAQDMYGNAIPAAKSWRFTVIRDRSAQNTVVAGDRKTAVSIPPAALDADYYIVIDTAPLETSAGLSLTIDQANEKISRTSGRFTAVLGQSVRKMTAYSAGGRYAGHFLQAATIVLPYEKNASGMVTDSRGNSVKEKTLALYYLDEANDLWVKIPGSMVDTVNGTVSASVTHFSVFAILGGSDTDISRAYAYPVPWKPFDSKSANGTLEDGITFTGLGSEATIRIFTLTGELVKVIDYAYGGGSEQVTWDGKNGSNELCASGVYIYYIENDREHKTGKLVIIK